MNTDRLAERLASPEEQGQLLLKIRDFMAKAGHRLGVIVVILLGWIAVWTFLKL